MPWYKEWFGAEYLELYAHRDEPEAEEHIEFVERRLSSSGRPRAILDLACGAGRHTHALRQRGYWALGTDLSVTLLARRRELPRIAADMRLLPFRAGSFDWVLNFFTSFGYFESEGENFRVLEEVVRVLAPGGRFLIDILNADWTVRHLQRHSVETLSGRRIDIERWYDPERRRLNKRIRFATRDGAERTFLESVRAYRLEEVTDGLRWAGLEVDATFGDFQGEPHTDDSERLILVGTRPA
jgi:SAM-dependent methyltransferase